MLRNLILMILIFVLFWYVWRFFFMVNWYLWFFKKYKKIENSWDWDGTLQTGSDGRFKSWITFKLNMYKWETESFLSSNSLAKNSNEDVRHCLGEACKLQSVPPVGPLGHSGIEQTNMVKWGNNVQCKHQPVGTGCRWSLHTNQFAIMKSSIDRITTMYDMSWKYTLCIWNSLHAIPLFEHWINLRYQQKARI